MAQPKPTTSIRLGAEGRTITLKGVNTMTYDLDSPVGRKCIRLIKDLLEFQRAAPVAG